MGTLTHRAPAMVRRLWKIMVLITMRGGVRLYKDPGCWCRFVLSSNVTSVGDVIIGPGPGLGLAMPLIGRIGDVVALT